LSLLSKLLGMGVRSRSMSRREVVSRISL
jgi:hypothetical protein